MSDWNIGHGFDSATEDQVSGSGCDVSHSGGDCLVGRDTRHRNRVGWRRNWNPGTKTGFPHHVGGLYFHDDGAADGVVDVCRVDTSPG